MSPILEQLLRLASPEARLALASVDEEQLTATASRLADRALSEHPDFQRGDHHEFIVHVGASLTGATPLENLHAEDLYLAFACLRGDPVAVSRFEATYGQDIDRGLAKGSPASDADRGQIVRTRLLVGDPPRPPKLASYRGEGALLHWLRVAVVRMRVDFARAPERPDAPTAALPHVSGVVGANHGPELEYLREHYRGALEDAFSGALAELSAKDRNILRQHLVEELSARRLAGLYNVDHTTVSRWIRQARDRVWTQTRRRIRESLDIEHSEFDSLLQLVRSQLDVSVGRLLEE